MQDVDDDAEAGMGADAGQGRQVALGGPRERRKPSGRQKLDKERRKTRAKKPKPSARAPQDHATEAEVDQARVELMAKDRARYGHLLE